MTSNQPDVEQVYECGQIGRAYYVAMEFLDGSDLGGRSLRVNEAQDKRSGGGGGGGGGRGGGGGGYRDRY